MINFDHVIKENRKNTINTSRKFPTLGTEYYNSRLWIKEIECTTQLNTLSRKRW